MAKQDNFSLANYTEEELIAARNKLEVQYGQYIEECGRQAGILVKEKGVNPDSFWGEKKINKLIKKYSNITADIQLAIEDINIELQKRDNYRFEQSFLGGKSYHDTSLSEKEFFEKESLKTLKYKQGIKTDEYFKPVHVPTEEEDEQDDEDEE